MQKSFKLLLHVYFDIHDSNFDTDPKAKNLIGSYTKARNMLAVGINISYDLNVVQNQTDHFS